MVVIYVPEDKRWSTIGEGLGKGLGGLLAGWAEGHANQQMATEIAQMSKDPKYTNNPQQLYLDADAKFPGRGGAFYLKSLDAGLKVAEAKRYSSLGGTADLDRQKKELEIRELEERLKREPQNAEKIRLDIEKAKQDLDVGAATAPARKQEPGVRVERTQEENIAYKQGANSRARALNQPIPYPEIEEPTSPPTSPPTPEPPPKPQSSVQLPGEASKQLSALSGDEDPERARAVSRFGDIDKPLASLASLNSAYPQYAQADIGTATDAESATSPIPSVTTQGAPPADINAPANSPPGPETVMPSLQPSLVRGGAIPAPPPPPPLAPPQIPATPRAPVPTGQPPAVAAPGGGPPAVTTPPPAPTQEQPLGLAKPGSDQYKAQEEVLKTIPEGFRGQLRAEGIEHPQEQIEVWNKVANSTNKDFAKVRDAAVKEIHDRHEREAEHADTEAALDRRYQDSRMFEQWKFMKEYSKPQLMRDKDADTITAAMNIMETNKPFLNPRTTTGGWSAGIYNWLQNKGFLQGNPFWIQMSTEANQQVVAAATTGGGLAGGKWRTQNAQMVTPDIHHQNFQNVMMIQSSMDKMMTEMQTLYATYKGKPGQEENADMIARVYNAAKAQRDQADTLWWGQDVAPDGKTLTGPMHYFYQGKPVDSSLREQPGGPQMLQNTDRYKNRMTGEVKDGAALNDLARKAGMIPSAYLRTYTWAPDGG